LGVVSLKPRTAETILAELATSEKGLVTRRALLAEGLTDDEIRWRLSIGALLLEHRGVYRVGHRAPNTDATYLAAVRACGERALLYGPAAAYLWRVLKGRPPRPEVIAPTERRVAGVITHRSRRLHQVDAALCRGIPVTSVPRTIVDMAGRLSLDDLARLCHEAGVLHDTTPRQVYSVLERRPNATGAKKLHLILRGDAPVTLSKLERRFLELLRANGLPLPITNRVAGGRRVDCRWPEHRLIVELDSYRYHHSRHAWEQDRRREREARARGDEFRRYTYGDVFEEPEPMMAELRMLLGS
jgi:very-short-patch-repair endonuclease